MSQHDQSAKSSHETHIAQQGSTALGGVGVNPSGIDAEGRRVPPAHEEPLHEEPPHHPQRKPSVTDKASGKIDQAIGQVKESFGKAVGSESMAKSGEDQKLEGAARAKGEKYERQREL